MLFTNQPTRYTKSWEELTLIHVKRKDLNTMQIPKRKFNADTTRYSTHFDERSIFKPISSSSGYAAWQYICCSIFHDTAFVKISYMRFLLNLFPSFELITNQESWLALDAGHGKCSRTLLFQSYKTGSILFEYWLVVWISEYRRIKKTDGTSFDKEMIAFHPDDDWISSSLVICLLIHMERVSFDFSKFYCVPISYWCETWCWCWCWSGCSCSYS